jgi:hypothetical protein
VSGFFMSHCEQAGCFNKQIRKEIARHWPDGRDVIPVRAFFL